MAVKKGNTIKVEYVGSLENGEIFDSSQIHGAPLEFEVGSGNMIAGFDEAVEGMEVNQEKSVVFGPEKAYGDRNPKMVQKIARAKLPQGLEPKSGMMLAMQLANGQQLPVRIAEVDDMSITVDLNHPLAGKTLKFWIKVVEVR